MSGKQKKGGFFKWIVIAVIIIAVIGSAGETEEKPKLVESTQENEGADTAKTEDSSNDDTKKKDTKKEDSEKETKKEMFYKGETAELNDVQVTMTDYEISNGSEFNYPADGNEFILAEFEIVNNSDEELAISSMLSFEAYADDYALEYSISAMLEKQESKQLDGSVATGKKMKGVIGYEVPKGWKKIEIHFTENVWDDNAFKYLIEQ